MKTLKDLILCMMQAELNHTWILMCVKYGQEHNPKIIISNPLGAKTFQCKQDVISAARNYISEQDGNVRVKIIFDSATEYEIMTIEK